MPHKWTGPTRILGTKMCLPPNHSKIDDTTITHKRETAVKYCVFLVYNVERQGTESERAWWLSCQSYGTM